MNLIKPAMDSSSLRTPQTPPYVPTDRQSPWREPYAQTPKEEVEDEPQPLDFSRKTTPVTRIPELQDSVQLTPSPTPPEPPSQAFMHPFSDVMMSFGTTTAISTTAVSPGAKTVNGDNCSVLSSSGSPPSTTDVSPPHQAQTFDVNGSLLAPILRQAQPAFPSSEPARNGTGQTKYTRPFKAYPRDPLSVPLGYYGLPMQLSMSPEALAAQSIITSASDQAYMQFRQQMLLTRSRTTPEGRRNRPMQDVGSSPALTRRDNLQDSEGEHTSSDNSNGATPNRSNGNSLSMAGDKKRGRLPDDLKDEAYWERRRKNNEAAKRSRDARRAKEDEIAIRAAFLEQENLKLRVEVAALKNELSKLRCLLYSN